MMEQNIRKLNYKKDAIVNTIAQLFYLFILWLMTLLTPRFGNSADAGIFTICLSVSNICTAIATYSINFYVASDIKKKYNDQHYFYFGLSSTVISLLVSVIVALSFGYFTDSTLFWAVILYYVFKCAENLTIITTSSMQRAGKLYICGYVLIIKAVLVLGFFSLTLFLSKNIALTFGVLAIFAILYFIFVDFLLLKKFTNVSYRFTKEIYKISLGLFLLAFPVFLYGISFASIVSFPRMVLNQFTSKEVVGYFGSMAAVSSVIQSAFSALFIPFIPKITTLFEKNKKKDLFKLLLYFALFIIAATLIAFLCACFLDKWLLGIIYPNDLNVLDFAYYFKWIILATGVQALVILSCLTLISLRKLYILTIVSALGLIFVFICSDTLIPNYCIDGVIYTYVISYGIEFIVGLISIIYFIKSKQNEEIKIKHIEINKEKDKKTEALCGLVDLHKDCLNILKEINQIAKKNNIQYSTYSGTMIGHIRHKGFIPWDDDVDILMTRDNFDKFFNVWSDNKHFKLLTPLSYNGDFVDAIYRIINIDSSYKNYGDFNLYKELSHPWVDVFVLDAAPKNTIKFKLHSFHLKVLYALMSSKKKLNVHLNRPFIEKTAMFIFKIIGKMFSLKYLYKRFNKVSIKYNKNNKKFLHASNSMLDIDVRISISDIMNTVYLPFSDTKLQCFAGYDKILRDSYNNYMEPRIDAGKWIRHFDLTSASDEEIANFYLK